MAAFSVVVQDKGQAPITSASVGIFSTNGVPIMSTTTDVDGVALLVTDEDTVSLTVSKARYEFQNRFYVSPEDGDVFDVTGELLDVAPPANASLCRVHGTIRDALGHALHPKWKFNLALKNQVGTDYSDDLILTSAKLGHNDGFVLIDLIRGAEYTLGPLPISSAGDIGEYDSMSTVSIKVPDKSTAKLVDLIALRAESVSLSTDAVELKLGDSATINIQVLLTNDEYASSSFDYVDIDNESSEIKVSRSANSFSVSGSAQGVYTVDIYNKRAATTLETLFYRPQPTKVLTSLTIEIV